MSAELDLAPIKARAEAATEGPWQEWPGGDEPWAAIGSGPDSVVHGYYVGMCPECSGELEDEADVALGIEDAEFIAHARTDVPALVAEVERLRRGGRTLGQIIDKAHLDVLDATQMHHVINEDGDGDWALVWERLHELCRIGRNYQEAVRGL